MPYSSPGRMLAHGITPSLRRSPPLATLRWNLSNLTCKRLLVKDNLLHISFHCRSAACDAFKILWQVSSFGSSRLTKAWQVLTNPQVAPANCSSGFLWRGPAGRKYGTWWGYSQFHYLCLICIYLTCHNANNISFLTWYQLRHGRTLAAT